MSGPSNSQWASALLDTLVAGGVHHAVLSPGSRNTPIVLALHRLATAGLVTLHDVLDERTAGFFALGLARITGEPVLLSCTSGSAGAHYLPAMVEAWHDRLPLLAVTADRPPELQGVGAPQTTVQQDFFAAHVRFHAASGPPEPDASLESMVGLATRTLEAALGPLPGPAHLNLAFRKPLWDDDLPPCEMVSPERGTREPVRLSDEVLEALTDRVGAVTRGVIVCGPGDLGGAGRPRLEQVQTLRMAVGRLADTLGWPVLIDGASSLRATPAIPGAVHVGDTLSRTPEFADGAAPELVLRMGQIPSSTPLRRWLAQHGQGRTLLIDEGGLRHDPDHLEAELLTAEPTTTLSALAERLTARGVSTAPSWTQRWRNAVDHVESKQDSLLLEGDLWGGSTARVLCDALPDGGLLHTASSLAVRAVDAFGGSTAPDTLVTSNRGVNGIDGTLATAFGQAAVWDGPTAVLVGDLAFLHDIGSLATLGAQTDRPPMVIVVLDNRGGGIFDHLPIAEHPTAHEPHFVTPPRTNIVALASAITGTCQSLTCPASLRAALDEAFTQPGVTVLHVPFDRQRDLDRHHAAWALGEEVGA